MSHIDDSLLNEYLDSALAPERRAEIAAHLAVCASCTARLANARALFAAIESLPDAPLERDLSGQVIAALRLRSNPLPLAVRLAFAAQAVFAVVLAASAAATLSLSLAPADPFINSALEAFTQSAESLMVQWQALIESAQSAIASGWDSALAFLPASLEWTWGAGLAAVFLLWLAGNGVILRRFILSPQRSRP
jgi:hypothetical protein